MYHRHKFLLHYFNNTKCSKYCNCNQMEIKIGKQMVSCYILLLVKSRKPKFSSCLKFHKLFATN